MDPRLNWLRVVALLAVVSSAIAAEVIPSNEDESKVPPYTLPDPLVFADGRPVQDAAAWRQRRAEILELYRSHVYGRTPKGLPRPKGKVLSTEADALAGVAVRKIVRVPLTSDPKGPAMDVLIYLPKSAVGPVPAFVGYNFNGNHAVTLDPGVPLARSWVENRKETGITDHVANERSRGSEASAWPIGRILARGYAVATIYYGDVEADFDGGWKTGLRGAVAKEGPAHVFAPDEWGAIGAWAWGLSRALDHLETDRAIDGQHVAVIGHSRLGKTSL